MFFLPIRTSVEFNPHIQETNVLTIFHEDWGKNVSSRLFTCFRYIHIETSAPSPGGHVFLLIMTIFELVRDIYKIDPCFFLPIQTIFELNRLFTCFHNIHIEKTAPLPGGHVFSPIWTILKLVRDINETKFHDDWATIVTSRVFTRNTAPPPGGHLHEDWASNVTSTVFTSNLVFNPASPTFELGRGIIGTNVLTKVFTRQMLTTDGRRTKGDHKSSP
ncbi:hypothetical protein DPMN_112169 [Dreissena polymorpha]|uniref:Uncharacterized protein n=1 Tax=Dreissena polymorpha TaxID=45954 RepID=A0A9D4QPN7_DREPO|nr:hypothetical protein DPMN_112169 [Dreissena polymorpha]